MSKFTEFYKKAAADEAAKKEITAILGDKPLNEATDEELAKVGEVAKKLGFDITVEEAKAFLNGGNAELDDEELDAVAGGNGKGCGTSPEENGRIGGPFVLYRLKGPDDGSSESSPSKPGLCPEPDGWLRKN